jgi:hypothetical protein
MNSNAIEIILKFRIIFPFEGTLSEETPHSKFRSTIKKMIERPYSTNGFYKDLRTRINFLQREQRLLEVPKLLSKRSLKSKHSLGHLTAFILMTKKQESAIPGQKSDPGRQKISDSFRNRRMVRVPLAAYRSAQNPCLPTPRPLTDQFGIPFGLPIIRTDSFGSPILVPRTDSYGKLMTNGTVRRAKAAYRLAQTPCPQTDMMGHTTQVQATSGLGRPLTTQNVHTMTVPLPVTNHPIDSVTTSLPDDVSYIYITVGVAVPLIIVAIIVVCVIFALKKRSRQISGTDQEH